MTTRQIVQLHFPITGTLHRRLKLIAAARQQTLAALVADVLSEECRRTAKIARIKARRMEAGKK